MGSRRRHHQQDRSKLAKNGRFRPVERAAIIESNAIVSVLAETSVRDFARDSAYDDEVPDGPYIAESASLIGDPARANMLAALMDGRALSATELGLAAGVAASTASGHLAKLVEGRLLAVISSGRHRYFKLASPAVARVLEELMVLAGEGPPRHRPRSRCSEEMAKARTCYDHFAGKLGVAIADSLSARGFVQLGEDGGLVSDSGTLFLSSIGVAVEQRQGSRRPLCRACLDWSERRWHIGGSLGAALARHCFEAGWTERRKNSRAVAVTAAGERAFEELLGVRL